MGAHAVPRCDFRLALRRGDGARTARPHQTCCFHHPHPADEDRVARPRTREEILAQRARSGASRWRLARHPDVARGRRPWSSEPQKSPQRRGATIRDCSDAVHSVASHLRGTRLKALHSDDRQRNGSARMDQDVLVGALQLLESLGLTAIRTAMVGVAVPAAFVAPVVSVASRLLGGQTALAPKSRQASAFRRWAAQGTVFAAVRAASRFHPFDRQGAVGAEQPGLALLQPRSRAAIPRRPPQVRS